MTKPRKEQLAEGVTLWLGDCRDVLPSLSTVDVVVTDPPYPNNANLFLDGIQAARDICKAIDCDHWIVFWTEIEAPPVPEPLCAVHIWYRTNTNRPDNYEAIFEFCRDGRKRASRVMPWCVIAPGLTGIIASGHPTEKHVGLMRGLVERTDGLVLDPFMGSGTTGVACANLDRQFIGVEREPKYFDIACRRISDALKRPRLPFEQPRKIEQGTLAL